MTEDNPFFARISSRNLFKCPHRIDDVERLGLPDQKQVGSGSPNTCVVRCHDHEARGDCLRVPGVRSNRFGATRRRTAATLTNRAVGIGEHGAPRFRCGSNRHEDHGSGDRCCSVGPLGAVENTKRRSTRNGRIRERLDTEDRAWLRRFESNRRRVEGVETVLLAHVRHALGERGESNGQRNHTDCDKDNLLDRHTTRLSTLLSSLRVLPGPGSRRDVRRSDV